MRGEVSGRAFRIAEVLRKLPVFSAVAEGVDQHEEKAISVTPPPAAIRAMRPAPSSGMTPY